MMTKYKLLIQYNENSYERLIVHINKYISEIETIKIGDIQITDDDIDFDGEITPSLDINAYDKLSYDAREYLTNYTMNMYNTMNSIFLYGNKTFTGIEIVEIKEND